MKLIFVRHGEPCRDNYGISEMGIKELELLADYLEKNHNISEIYSASSLRASESAEVLNRKYNKKIIIKEWLSEFKYRIPAFKDKMVFPFEYAPEYWINNDEMLGYKDVMKTSLLTNSDVVLKADEVWAGLDRIIEENGYTRNGNLYTVKNANKDEILIVTHFATMAVMVSHLMNISILIALNMLYMAPSSYSVFASEEIEKGKCIFRCLELGSTKHLFNHNELKSEYGRQTETQ